ncbi:MAG: sigma-70 family RNA polymerase sigma factor [Actinomycetota bacterium]
MSYDDFVLEAGARLRTALVSAYGLEVGIEATSEALAYGWEAWDRLQSMDNPVGYLYRVGQTAAGRYRRPAPLLDRPLPQEIPDFEPALVPALTQLSEQQLVCVLLIHGHGWTRVEVAEVLDVSADTVRTHLERGTAKLQRILKVAPDAR